MTDALCQTRPEHSDLIDREARSINLLLQSGDTRAASERLRADLQVLGPNQFMAVVGQAKALATVSHSVTQIEITPLATSSNNYQNKLDVATITLVPRCEQPSRPRYEPITPRCEPVPVPVPRYEPMPVPRCEPIPVPRYEPVPVPRYEPIPVPRYERIPVPRYEPIPVPRCEPAPLPVPRYEPLPRPRYEPVPRGEVFCPPPQAPICFPSERSYPGDRGPKLEIDFSFLFGNRGDNHRSERDHARRPSEAYRRNGDDCEQPSQYPRRDSRQQYGDRR